MNSAVAEAEERLKDWELRAGAWYVAYYALGILSTILVITAASKPPFLTEYSSSVIIWIAAISQGLNTFLISMKKASSYRAAWRKLKYALIDYKASPDDAGKKDAVMAAIKSGWQTIDEGYSSD